MTEAQAIIEYVYEHGSIIPAKMHAKVYKGHFFGSEVTRQCRALRDKGELASRQVGKFTEFFLPSQQPVERVERRYLKLPNGGTREILIHKR